MLLESTPPGGIPSCYLTVSLVDLLKLSFEHTHEIEYLNESVDLLTGVLNDPAGQALCDGIVWKLTSSLFEGDKLLLDKQDFHVSEAIHAIYETIQNVNETLTPSLFENDGLLHDTNVSAVIHGMHETIKNVNGIFQLAADNSSYQYPADLGTLANGQCHRGLAVG